MTEPVRPWWASTEAADGAADGVDPVEAFRAARRPRTGPTGDATTDGGSPATGWSSEAGEGSGEAGSGQPSQPGVGEEGTHGSTDGSTGHRPELCGVCPVCTLGRYVEDQHPELAVHLGEAARHLSAALRVLLEPPAPPADTGVQRIDLDRDTGDDG